MSKEQDIFRVTIERQGSYKIEITDECLEVAIGEAILSSREPRLTAIVAEVALHVFELGPEDDEECWPGYQEALNKLRAGVQEIVDGWAAHDSPSKESEA